MSESVQIVRANTSFREAVIALLKAEKLPISDLPESLNNFFVALNQDVPVGAIGLEQHGNNGLLRSLVVKLTYRNKQIADKLILALEQEAIHKNIARIYLLTETAPNYFGKKGYQTITREEVPEVLKQSSEFSYVCPVSAIVMKKSLL